MVHLRTFANCLAAALCSIAAATDALADCTFTSTGVVPLFDLGPGTYERNGSWQGGLYPGGANVCPPDHWADGLAAIAGVRPRNAAGAIDNANGQIGFVSIGFSNNTQTFSTGQFGDTSGTFKVRMDAANSGKFSRVTLVDGANPGYSLQRWAAPNDAEGAWAYALGKVAEANLTNAQVQVGWVYVTHRTRDLGGTDQAWPRHAERMRDDLAFVARTFKTHFPNAAIVFLSAHTRPYSDDPFAVGIAEPWAYESGFGVKWLIEAQINGTGDLNFDAAQGPAVAPYLAWGPYLYADGITPRSDGFTWLCSDLVNDFSHPSPNGLRKNADQLIAHMKTSPLSRPWFVRGSTTGQPPTVAIDASTTSGTAPLVVDFDAIINDPDGTITERAWTFGDGGFSMQATATKTYLHPGEYIARLAATDSSGNVRVAETTITVTAPATVVDSMWID